MTPGTLSGYSLDVTSDTTQRGTTGMSFSAALRPRRQADGAIRRRTFPSIRRSRARRSTLAFAQPQITASTVAGDTVVASGDASGLLALQKVEQRAADIPGRRRHLRADDVARQLCAQRSTRTSRHATQTAKANQHRAGDRLTGSADPAVADSGVNLDKELSNMVMYQQAYSAGARMLTVVQPAVHDPAADSVRSTRHDDRSKRRPPQSQYMLSRIKQDESRSAHAARSPPVRCRRLWRHRQTRQPCSRRRAPLPPSPPPTRRRRNLPSTRPILQDTQLSSLSASPSQLRRTLTKAVANNDGSTMMIAGQRHLRADRADPEFAGRQRQLHLWRRQGQHAAGQRHDDGAARRAASVAASAFANGTLKKSVVRSAMARPCRWACWRPTSARS